MERGKGAYANDGVWADKLDQLVGDGALGVTVGISLVVAKVTNVALLISWGSVVGTLWVDWNMSVLHYRHNMLRL